jgi:DNA invertase Pin-like site-specific DNA recombinase
MATTSYKERMAAARAAASAARRAEREAWQRRAELSAEVRRLALAATKATIRDRGEKLSLYSPAQLRAQADAMIGPWLVVQAKARIAERNSQVMSKEACDARASVERNSCTEWSGEMIKGYARVSTDGQDLATQHELLKAAGAELIYSEKQSGVKTDRAALARCMRSVEAGDIVVVTKLDRLARSTRDLLNTLATIGEASASFRSLGDPWADTTTPHGRLMLTVLGGLAEFERHLILSRTDEGRIQAKARGVRFGRKPKLTKHQQAEALARVAQGETLTAIARSFNVSHMTISRLA